MFAPVYALLGLALVCTVLACCDQRRLWYLAWDRARCGPAADRSSGVRYVLSRLGLVLASLGLITAAMFTSMALG